MNLIPRSAFERTRPLFNYSVSALMQDNNKSLSATPGPRGHPTAAFVRGDVSFVDNRLKFVVGLRAEQTNIDGEGPLNDPTRNYQRDIATASAPRSTTGATTASTSTCSARFPCAATSRSFSTSAM